MVRMISVMTITARILIDNNSKQITTVVEYNLTHVYEPNLKTCPPRRPLKPHFSGENLAGT
jgi:hypothetical protein